MAENTGIQWCDHTFNAWRGCQKVAAGCKNCYADDMSRRFGEDFARERYVLAEAGWREPHRWNRRAEKQGRREKVFSLSRGDVFEDWQGPMLDHNGQRLWLYPPDEPGGQWVAEAEHDEADLKDNGWRPVTMDECRARLVSTIDATPNLDWLLLTKRPENIRRMIHSAIGFPNVSVFRANQPDRVRTNNVWLLTSIANQEDADRNIPELLKCRDLAPVLGLSIEPMVGPVDLTSIHVGNFTSVNCLAGKRDFSGYGGKSGSCDSHSAIDWVIVGAESGPNARPCNVEWILSIVEQCRVAGVPCFVKQLGARPILDYYSENDFIRDWALDYGYTQQFVGGAAGFTRWDHATFGQPHPKSRIVIDGIKHPKGGDMSEWPEDLRVREFPKCRAT